MRGEEGPGEHVLAKKGRAGAYSLKSRWSFMRVPRKLSIRTFPQLVGTALRKALCCARSSSRDWCVAVVPTDVTTLDVSDAFVADENRFQAERSSFYKQHSLTLANRRKSEVSSEGAVKKFRDALSNATHTPDKTASAFRLALREIRNTNEGLAVLRCLDEFFSLGYHRRSLLDAEGVIEMILLLEDVVTSEGRRHQLSDVHEVTAAEGNVQVLDNMVAFDAQLAEGFLRPTEEPKSTIFKLSRQMPNLQLARLSAHTSGSPPGQSGLESSTCSFKYRNMVTGKTGAQSTRSFSAGTRTPKAYFSPGHMPLDPASAHIKNPIDSVAYKEAPTQRTPNSAQSAVRSRSGKLVEDLSTGVTGDGVTCSTTILNQCSRFIEGGDTTRPSVTALCPFHISLEELSTWIDSTLRVELQRDCKFQNEVRRPSSLSLFACGFYNLSEDGMRSLQLGCEMLIAGLAEDAESESSARALAFAFSLCCCMSEHAKCSTPSTCEKLLDAAAHCICPDSPISAIADSMIEACGKIRLLEAQARLRKNSDSLRLYAAERSARLRVFSRAVSRHQSPRADVVTDAILTAVNEILIGVTTSIPFEMPMQVQFESIQTHATTTATFLGLVSTEVRRAIAEGDVAATKVAKALFQLSSVSPERDATTDTFTFWMRYVEWCLEFAQTSQHLDEMTLLVLKRQVLHTLHLWLSLTRTALSLDQPSLVQLHRKLLYVILGGSINVSVPIQFLASALDADLKGCTIDGVDIVEEALWPITLAVTTAVSSLVGLARTLVPLHFEALRDAFAADEPVDGHLPERWAKRAILHIRCLLALAAHADPADGINAFRNSEVVPWLLTCLNPPFRDRGSDNPLSTEGAIASTKGRMASSKVGDEILAFAAAKNDKKRWFPATILRINADGTFDLKFSTGSVELAADPSCVRSRSRQKQRAALLAHPTLHADDLPKSLNDETSIHASAFGQPSCSARSRISTDHGTEHSNASEDAWFFEIPPRNPSSALSETRLSSRRKLLRDLVGKIDVQSATSDTGSGLIMASSSLSCIVTASPVSYNHTDDVVAPIASEQKKSTNDMSPIVLDAELHELALTLLLCLSIGRSSRGGELEPAFCTTYPFTPIGSRHSHHKSAVCARELDFDNRTSKPTTPVVTPDGTVSERVSLTDRSMSPSSLLYSARSSDYETAKSRLLDFGSSRSALGFHVLDTLHRHFNFGSKLRRQYVASIVPRIIQRLEAWRVIDQPLERADGAIRLLRLLCPDAVPNLDELKTCFDQASTATVIGQGRFGTVIAVERGRAAKFIQRERSDKDRSVAHDMFCEISALERLSKFPGAVVKIFNYGVLRESYVVVLEKCDGGTVASWRQNRRRSRPTESDVADYLRVFAKIASCVACVAAANIVHLDLKCENVLLRADPLTFDNRDNAVCLTDFGEARILGDERSGGATLWRAHGTECIQPPEVLSGVQRQHCARRIDTSADVWALGCLLYELVCGKKLFEEIASVDWPQFFVLLVNSSNSLPPQELLEPLNGLKQNGRIVKDLLKLILQRDPALRPTAAKIVSLASVGAAPFQD